MHWANICLFDPDMLVFVDESGFVSSQATNLHIAKVLFSTNSLAKLLSDSLLLDSLLLDSLLSDSLISQSHSKI